MQIPQCSIASQRESLQQA